MYSATSQPPLPDSLSVQQEAYKSYIPWLTALLCIISVILFTGINLEPTTESWEALKKWGCPSADDLYSGAVWGTITSNFLHIDFWHLAFNLYWFWKFGKKIEFESGKAFYALLIFTAAFISSVFELIFSDATGIGLSGVVYSFFGFLYVKSKTDESYNGFLEQNTSLLFILWLLLCIILSYMNIWQIGNVAHVSGLAWGALLGYLLQVKSSAVRYGIPTFLFMLSALPLFWAPWSVAWLSSKAFHYHNSKNIEEATRYYNKVLALEADNEVALLNLKALRIAALSKQAYKEHSSSNYDEAKKLYQQIMALDPENKWAKENFELLTK